MMKRWISCLLALCLACAVPAALAEPEIIVPQEYKTTGTLPVYRATVRDFGADLQPELFNRTGIQKTERYLITFNDEAQLSWAPEALFYGEYRGTYNANYKNPELEASLCPMETIAHAAGNLAGDVYAGWPDDGQCWEGITLQKTALSGITLDEARAKLETLLSALRVEGYSCDFALDMDVARIQTMGAQMNQMIRENEYWNPPILDYTQATAADEGYYLHYSSGVETGDGRFNVFAYVTAGGIPSLQVRDQCIRGEIVETPGALITPETVEAALPLSMADARFGGELDSIRSLTLTYSLARAADRANGMVFTPAWYVVYRDAHAVKYDYDCFAIYDAVNGTLLGASFQ